MAERPILFSAPMVRAILAGTKTQTRREFKTRNGGLWPNPNDRPGMKQLLRECRYGKPGDRLWVREAWSHDAESLEQCRASLEDAMGGGGYGPYYRATESAPDTLRWRPSIHMPRWASRITLVVTGVRIEKLQEISSADAKAEGCEHNDPCDHVRLSCKEIGCEGPDYRPAYRKLWEQINGPASWAENPWVWVVEFKRIEAAT